MGALAKLSSITNQLQSLTDKFKKTEIIALLQAVNDEVDSTGPEPEFDIVRKEVTTPAGKTVFVFEIKNEAPETPSYQFADHVAALNLIDAGAPLDALDAIGSIEMKHGPRCSNTW